MSLRIQAQMKDKYCKSFLEKNESNTSNISIGIRQLVILKRKNRIQPSILTVNATEIANPL